MMLDRMKDLGYKYSTRAGLTVGIADISVAGNKKDKFFLMHITKLMKSLNYSVVV